MATSHESTASPISEKRGAIGLTEITGSSVSGDYESEIANASDAGSDSTLLESIENFEKERLAERSKQLSLIVMPGLYMICASTAAFCLLFIFKAVNLEISIALYDCIYVTVMFIFISGFIILSSARTFDIDDYVKGYFPLISHMAVYVGLIFSILAASIPPYLGIIQFTFMSYHVYEHLTLTIDKRSDFTFMGSWFTILIGTFCACPIFAGIMYSSGIEDSEYSVFETCFTFTIIKDPDDQIGINHALLVGTTFIIVGLLYFWYYWLPKYWQISRLCKGSTAGLYDTIIGFLLTYGIGMLSSGIYFISSKPFIENAGLQRAICFLLPLIFSFYIGRDNFGNILMLYFDSNSERQEKDGAFIAGLLNNIEVALGDPYFIHRDNDDKNTSFPSSDVVNYNWDYGYVSEIHSAPDGSPTNFSVILYDESRPKPPTFPYKTVKAPKDLLKNAKSILRCVNWETIQSFGPDLFNGSVRETNVDTKTLYAMSRPLGDDQKSIDYFISHAWADNDHQKKYDTLARLSQEFHLENGRYPNFWFDKLCIDQENLDEGLSVLPINIMKSNQLLVLAGRNYISRLWCIWELFTLFAFMSEALALQKIKLESIDEPTFTAEMLESMRYFDISSCKCYSPNETGKIREIIFSVGADRFNNRIRKFANLLIEQKAKQNELNQV